MRALLPVVALNVLSAAAFAHPGHGSSEPASASHFLLEPVHAVPLAVIAIVAASAWLLLKRRHVNRAASEPVRKTPRH
jgi:hypothetical protein